MQSLAGYAVRDLSSNLHIKFLPPSSDRVTFENIEKAMTDLLCYEFIYLIDVLSKDAMKRCQELEKLMQVELSILSR